MKDTDCKADRICETGICTAPKSNVAPPENTISSPAKQEIKLSSDSGTDSECEEGRKGIPAYGSAFNNGIYLCREPVEIYWNDWYALNAVKNTLEIQGEGKTASFSGRISVNCNTGTHTWSEIENTSNDIAQTVPLKVIYLARQYICKNN
jgi:hypothetical protein